MKLLRLASLPGRLAAWISFMLSGPLVPRTTVKGPLARRSPPTIVGVVALGVIEVGSPSMLSKMYALRTLLAPPAPPNSSTLEGLIAYPGAAVTTVSIQKLLSVVDAVLDTVR